MKLNAYGNKERIDTIRNDSDVLLLDRNGTVTVRVMKVMGGFSAELFSGGMVKSLGVFQSYQGAETEYNWAMNMTPDTLKNFFYNKS